MAKNRVWIIAVILIVGSLVFILRQFSEPKSLAVHDTLNAEGIRPDVAAEIAKAFPESQKKRAAATQLARAFQRGIETPESALEVYAAWERAQTCLNAIEGSSYSSEPDTSSRVESWVVNSTLRSRAYIHYNAGLSGRILKGSGIDYGGCDFDPSKMRN